MKELLRLTRLFVCLCTVLSSTTAFADAQWLGNSYIKFNNTWYQAHGTESWATGGAFDGKDLGSFTSLDELTLGGQLQIGDNGNNWQSGDGDWMHYKIDNGAIISGDIHLSYESYGYGEYYNNMRFQSGGGNFMTTSIDISNLALGEHTLTVWFGPVDGIYEAGGSSETYYTANFTKSAYNINDATVTGIESSYDWTGSLIHPVPVVKVGDYKLESGTDYTVIYDNNTDFISVGTHTVIIEGIAPNFTGQKTVPFNIKNPAGYYLVGTMNSWTPNVNYLLTENTNTDNEYFINNVGLTITDQFKVIYSNNDEAITDYYPDGTGNNFGENGEIQKDGFYTIYFRPNGDGGEDWYYNVIYVAYEGASPTVDVTLSPKGFGTYYHSRCAVTLPDGLVAFILTGVSGSLPIYEMIASGSNSLESTVPADVAVLLYKAAPDKPNVFTLTLTPSSSSGSYTDNLLKGSDVETTTTGGTTYYKLTYGNDNTTFGWYWGAEGGAAFTSPAHKAWLALPSSGARSFLNLPGDDITGIATVKDQQQNADNVWYDLNGRRINAPTTKGIYVNKGRKVVIK